MSVLRFQQPCPACPRRRGTICARVRPRNRNHRGARAWPRGVLDLSWRRHAFADAAEHLSLYQLTIEEGTPFFGLHAAGKLKTPDEATARALYDVTQEVCTGHGLPSYEISNHARAGAECRHNLVYWRGEEYAGIGPGAHGRLDIDGVRHAIATEKRPQEWL